ncbi:TTC21B [Scenedesmus sp. PABB004]|nr:TTC21B [Scenedesmus sp. PABB004]
MEPRLAACVGAYARAGQHHRVAAACGAALARGGGAPAQLWRAVGLLGGGAMPEAMRELYAVQSHPEVGLAATAALLAVHGAARSVDRCAVATLSAALEAGERGAAGPAALHLGAFLLFSHAFERARRVLERALQRPEAAPDRAAAARCATLLGHVLLEAHGHEAAELRDAGDVARALQLFDGVLRDDPDDLEALLGKAAALEAGGEARAAWELLSEASVRLPWAVPALEELARLTLAQQDWEGLAEVAARLRGAEPGNLAAATYCALTALLVDGDAKAAARQLGEAAAALQQAAPRNATLMLQLAAPFARLAGGDAGMLAVTLGLAERALQLQPDSVDAAVEVGAQQLLLDQPAAAAERYEAALKLDELSMPAALGLVEALLATDRLDEAAAQLEFLPELLAASRAAGALSGGGGGGGAAGAGSVELGFAASRWRAALVAGGGGAARRGARASGDGGGGDGLQLVAGVASEAERAQRDEPLLAYLRGMLAWKRGEGEGLAQLVRFMELQLDAVKELPAELPMFAALHASRLLGTLRVLLSAAGGDPRQACDPPSPMLAGVLEMLGRFTLAHPEAQLLTARALYLNGALDAAARVAAGLLRRSPDSAQAALLVVSVHVAQGRPGEAVAALEAAVAANFGIRDAPLYHVVHAQALLAGGRLEEAKRVRSARARRRGGEAWGYRGRGGADLLTRAGARAAQVLEGAMALPGVCSAASPEQAARLARRGCLPSLHERATVFLLLAEVVGRLSPGGREAPEARKYLAEAVREFEGTREEARVMVADCEAAIAGGDVGGALARLRRVPASSPHYARARVAMAGIHLSHRRDRAAYVRCFLDLVVRLPALARAGARADGRPASCPARLGGELPGLGAPERAARPPARPQERTPDYDSHCRLAEAFLAIQEPDKAARAYESALALRPKDAELAAKVAAALTAAHDYGRAVDYYNRAIRNDPAQLGLQHGLARLLLRLGDTRAATALLEKCLDAHKGRNAAGAGLDALALDVDTWLLLAKLRQQSGDAEGFVAAQEQALELQRALLDGLRGGGGPGAAAAGDGGGGVGHGREGAAPPAPGAPAAGLLGGGLAAAVGSLGGARAKAAAICFDLAEHHRKQRAFERAADAYAACLAQHDKHAAARLALARLALAGGRVEECQAHAAALLAEQPDNEDAALMLAELMEHQDNTDAAVFYFSQLLERRPGHHAALAQLLGLLRRAGRLADAPKFIAAAEAAAGGAGSAAAAPGDDRGSGDAAGLSYCRGLLARYGGNPRDALRHLNAARRDARWSGPALLGMAETYLNPDALDAAWAEPAAAADGDGGAGGAAPGADAAEGAAAAAQLLQQLRPADMEGSRYKARRRAPRALGPRARRRPPHAARRSKGRGDVEAAVASLLDLASADANDVPVLLALAHGFMLLKQPAKARSQLKRVSKLPYRPDEGEQFERAWLALADVHVSGGALDAAQELARRCLRYNKSCARAWELLGAVAEREAAHADAAGHYERAWRLGGAAACGVGYKLAVSHLRAGRLVDAADVAAAVLRADPAFPRIRADQRSCATAAMMMRSFSAGGARRTGHLASIERARELSREVSSGAVTEEGTLLEYEALVSRLVPPQIRIDQEAYDDATLLVLDSVNRPGTLVEVVQCLTELGLNVKRARISSDGGWFVDEFLVSETPRGRVTDPKKLDAIKSVLALPGDTGEPAELNTVFQVAGPETPGLLAELAELLAHNGLQIRSVCAWTFNRRAAAVIGVTERGAPCGDSVKLQRLRSMLRDLIRGDAAVSVDGPVHHERRLHQLLLADEMRSWRQLTRLQRQHSLPFPQPEHTPPPGAAGRDADAEPDQRTPQTPQTWKRQMLPPCWTIDQRSGRPARREEQALGAATAPPPAGGGGAGPAGAAAGAPTTPRGSALPLLPPGALTAGAGPGAGGGAAQQASASLLAAGGGGGGGGGDDDAGAAGLPPRPPGLALPASASAPSSPTAAHAGGGGAGSLAGGRGGLAAAGLGLSPRAPPAVDLAGAASMPPPASAGLFFDSVCTICDLRFDVIHATIDGEPGGMASQLFYIRPRFGESTWDAGRAAVLQAMLVSSTQRRFPPGLRVHIYSGSTGCLQGLLSALRQHRLTITRCKVRAFEASSHTFALLRADTGELPSKELVAAACTRAGGELVDAPLDVDNPCVASVLRSLDARCRFAFSFTQRAPARRGPAPGGDGGGGGGGRHLRGWAGGAPAGEQGAAVRGGLPLHVRRVMHVQPATGAAAAAPLRAALARGVAAPAPATSSYNSEQAPSF